MHLSEIVAITGLPGLFKVAARRNDGLIVTSLLDDKTQFVSGRTNLFSSLDNITIYTTEDSVPLKDVLASIKKNEASKPVPDLKNDADTKAWLEAVIPNYDKEKVHVSDMKKLAKWYGILNNKNLIEELTAETAEGANTEETVKEVKTETKTKVAKADTSSKSHSKPAPVKKITTPRKAS